MEDFVCQTELNRSTDHILGDENHAEKSKLFTSCGPFANLRRASSIPRYFMSSTDSKRFNTPIHEVVTQTSVPSAKDGFKKDTTQGSDILSGKKLKHVDRTSSLFQNSNNTQPVSSFEIQPSSSTSHSHFHDPLIDELDAELPTPPPPPKALPFWLKMSLRKQEDDKQRMKLYQGPMSQSLTPPSSPLCKFENLNKRNSRSLGHDDVRICPIMQNGVKMSDTHYWLLQPPHSHRYKSSLLRIHSERVPPPTPTEFEPSKQYLNLHSPVKLRRGLSDSQKSMWSAVHREKVSRLLAEIPTATEAECQAVLIGCGYNYDEAVKRLKLELLYRQGYASRSRCGRLLHKNQWSLEEATRAARQEYQIQHPEIDSPKPTTISTQLRDQIFTFSEESPDTDIPK